MNIPFEHIVAVARKQAREARNTVFYVDLKEFEKQLYEGEAEQMVHKAACIVQYQNPDHTIDPDDPAHFAIETVIVAACITINDLRHNQ
jgi:hypothetical protein